MRISIKITTMFVTSVDVIKKRISADNNRTYPFCFVKLSWPMHGNVLQCIRYK